MFNFDKYIGTNVFCNLDKYILQSGEKNIFYSGGSATASTDTTSTPGWSDTKLKDKTHSCVCEKSDTKLKAKTHSCVCASGNCVGLR